MKLLNTLSNTFKGRPARNQDGLASIVVTGVLVALLSVMTVSFSAVMRRELTNSVQNQISQAAFYAAKSGINDAASYINSHPTASVTNCDTLVTGNGALASDSDLSGDGTTAYTCALIDTSPSSLEYQSIGTNTSQVFRGIPSSPMESMMLSWQASDRANNIFVPSAQAGSFYDETNWNANKYAPVLRVSLYPVSVNTKDIDYASTNSRTYFLYPTQTASSTVTEINYSSAANGTVQQVNCGVTNTGGNFNGTADYDCNLIVSNLPSLGAAGYLYYVRVTPIYGRADFKFKGNDNSSNPVDFSQTQALIDVTAQSAGALKRLQARVDISNLSGNGQDIAPSDQGFPDFAIQTADALCKRILVPSSASFPVYIDPASSTNCSASAISLPQLQPPIVTINCSPVGQNAGSCSGSVNPNNSKVTYCNIRSSDGQSTSCPTTDVPSTTPYSVSWSIGGLSSGTTYTITLCADNTAGRSSPCATSVFTTDSPPPPPPPIAPVCITYSVRDNRTFYPSGDVSGNCDATAVLTVYQANFVITDVSGNQCFASYSHPSSTFEYSSRVRSITMTGRVIGQNAAGIWGYGDWVGPVSLSTSGGVLCG